MMIRSLVHVNTARILRAGAAKLDAVAGALEQLETLGSKERRILSRNRSFCQKHKGQRAFVIANGPSLASQDLRPLSREITFVVSGFWKHPVLSEWQPTYYSIFDKAFFTGAENIREFYRQLNERVRTASFFLPLLRGYKAMEKYQYLALERCFFIASQGEVRNGNDLTGLVQGFQSVSAFALSQAIYMGCDPIYLLGFDHDYLSHRGVDHHFYKGCAIEGHLNATCPIAEIASYDSDMRAMLRLWENYRSLNDVAAKSGSRVLNATNGGYLDVFERANYQKIFCG